jgi:hypothetical protein
MHAAALVASRELGGFPYDPLVIDTRDGLRGHQITRFRLLISLMFSMQPNGEFGVADD